ncbi:MAG: excinuclease ABC subunit UvrC [Pseudomonadota bacterium]
MSRSKDQPRAPGSAPVDAAAVAADGASDPPDTDGPASTLLREAELEPARLTLTEILDRLPTEPGVYLMKDRRRKAVYIGKAANLRARVRQYFQPATGDSRLFVPLLEGIVADIETVVTTNEKEALLLENTLIKRHQPRFNVNLRDDKNYLVLRLDPQARWPRLEVMRKIADDGAFYFGPYHSASSCRETLRVVNRHFQLRTCTDHVLDSRRRPCLQYQIKRCPAPCVLPVDREEYGEQVRDVRLFLDGKDDELVGGLTKRMKTAAEQTQFEQAAAIRDQLRALEVTLQAQRVVSTDFVDQDVIGFYREGMALEIVVMAIRQGKLVGSRGFSFGGQEFPDSELLSSFIGLLYDATTASIPDEVLLPLPIEDAALKAEWLTERRPGRRRVEVLVPQRGDRKRLSDLAQRNAQVGFTTRRNAREDVEIMLAKLQRKLRLPKLPRVIECYDISHIQGFAPVASMVVFVDGRPERSRYRTYRVRGAEGPSARRGNDDFASMYEVLSRRLRRAREGDAGWELPDLIVIDGGKGQLGMALAAARDVGIDTRPGQGLAFVGLAKERDLDEEAEGDEVATARTVVAAAVATEPDAAATETTVAVAPAEGEQGEKEVDGQGGVTVSVAAPAAPAAEPPRRGRRRSAGARDDKAARGAERRPDRIYLPHAKDAIPIRPSSAEMFVLQHLRDEAHRFAVSFHRRRRGNLTLRSALADVPGIGPQRQRLLLRHFGSLKKIRDATVEELAAVSGMTAKAAAAVFALVGTPAPLVGGAGAGSRAAAAHAPTTAADPTDLNATPSTPVDAEDDAVESAFAEVDEDIEAEGEEQAGPESDTAARPARTRAAASSASRS